MRILEKISHVLKSWVAQRSSSFEDADARGRFRTYAIFCCTGVPLMVGFGIYNLIAGVFPLALLIFSAATGLLIGVLLLHLGIAPNAVYRSNSLVFYLLLLYMAALGGADGSKLLWFFTFPLIACFLMGGREGALWTMLLFVSSQPIIWNTFRLDWLHYYPAEFAVRFDLAFLCVATFTYFYERFRYNYRIQVEDQYQLLDAEIKERRKAEAALRLSEEKYRAIYLQAAEGLMIIDPQGKILESNPQMNRMLEVGGDDLIGKDIHEFIHHQDLQQVPSQLPEILGGKTVMLERRMRTGDGGYRLFERSGRMIDENRVLLLYRDITDRKAAELALERANRELDKLANLDGLTQIANRRKFESTLKAEWQRLSRERQPLAIIIGDIDFFKQYNDLYGHQEGDNCLITIAQTLEHALQRPADVVARFGGEEFILILPNTPLAGGVRVAEEIRKRVLLLRIPHKGSECSPYVTMSLGVSAIVPNTKCLPEDLIAVADTALYQAKQNGRNRCEANELRAIA